MKNKLFLTTTLLFFVLTSFGQNLKIGYTNVEYLVLQMPEYSSIEKQLQEYGGQLDRQLQAKMQEYETKYRDLEQNFENMLPEVAQDKQEELQNMQQSIQKFRLETQQSIQRKQNELLQPVYEKIENAIQTVAKAEGYTHIFSEGMGGVSVLLYARDEDDVTNKILKTMGITPKEITPSEN